jgi:hypothetical protein
MFTFFNKKIISGVLIFVLVFSIGFIPPKKAEAVGGMAGCLAIGVGILAGMASSVVPTSDILNNLKNQCLDGLVYVLNETILKKITADIINWINTGFDGNPAFVEDYQKMLRDIADEEFGYFIENSGQLGFLCSPFQLEIKKALYKSQSRTAYQKDISCKLSDVVRNVENFIEGDFYDGGWEAWRILATDNPYSQYMRVSAELTLQQQGAIQKKEIDVLNSRGFLSNEYCDEPPPQELSVFGGRTDHATSTTIFGSGAFGEFAQKEEEEVSKPRPVCKVVTPGSVIEAQLNNALQTGPRRLEMADEINEIVDTLLSHLVTEAFTKGLRNLSKKSSSGSTVTGQLQTNDIPYSTGTSTTTPAVGEPFAL